MKTATLQKTALTETYNDVERLICDCVWKFIIKYGFNRKNFDELKAQANLIFIEAYYSHKKNRSKFTTWLRHCIYTNLLTNLNKNYFKQPPTIHLDNHHHKLTHNFSSFHIFEMLEETSSDSRLLIRIIFEPPEGITNVDLEKGFNACQTRIYIKKYLSIKLGWTGKRIKESFVEIRGLLQ